METSLCRAHVSGTWRMFAFGAVMSPTLLLPAPAFAQGFFDFFTGGRPSSYDERPVVAYAPDPGSEIIEAPHAIRRAPATRRAKHARPKPLNELVFTDKPEKKPPPTLGDGPLAAFLNDPTLRDGDIVVTEQGLMIYRGSKGSAHRGKDFVAIARAHRLAKSERRFLSSIERANKQAPQIEVATEVRPVEEETWERVSNESTAAPK